MGHIGSMELTLESMRIQGSQKFYKICGVKRSLDPISFDDIIGIVKESDRPGILSALKGLKNGGKVSDYEFNIIRPEDGSTRSLRVSAQTQNKKGIPYKIIGVIQDVTEFAQAAKALQESERSKAVLLHNLPGMAYRCLYDRNYTMIFVSEGCYDLTGYNPEQLLKNRAISYNELICTEYRGTVWKLWEKAVALKKGCQLEYPIITAAGDKKWVWEQGQGVYDDTGNVLAIEGFIQDITLRKQKEEEAVYLNYHDVLTGLYNRTYFDEQRKQLDVAENLPLSVIVGDINGLKLINDAFGHTEGDKLLIEISKILQKCCRTKDIVARTGGDEFSILMPKTNNQTAETIQKLITEACTKYGNNTEKQTYYTSISLGNATKTFEGESFLATLKYAEQYMYKRKLLEQKSILSSIMSSIKSTMFEKSHETEEHAERLAELSKKVGRALKLSDGQLSELELLSTLHDIGKIGIDQNILSKKGRLTSSEWDEIKRHPEIGYRIAQSSAELKDVSEYILCHHESWDGNGYPQGLKGDAIPLLSRIISIIDAYDAMTQDRPYRKAMSPEAALNEIRINAGTQFDPQIARIFIKMISSDLPGVQRTKIG